jgi:hypothetical protein
MVHTSSQVDEWIGQAPVSQQSQLRVLRGIILALVPEAREALKWGQPCYTRNSLFCYLQRARTHVTLGFQRGALMSDPGKRLLGDGKQMRHVRFESGEAIDAALCRRLIEEALRLD